MYQERRRDVPKAKNYDYYLEMLRLRTGKRVNMAVYKDEKEEGYKNDFKWGGARKVKEIENV